MKNEQTEIENFFHDVFKREANLQPKEYEVRAAPTGYMGRFVVYVVWDGFEPMSVTTRQTWLWERLRKVTTLEQRQKLSMVITRTENESIVAEELSRQPNYPVW